ncbi:PhoX family protein [Pseudohongiella sp.]|uniref:Tat pathway signal protein n=1 Tax=marine sediment metagenome TaxID=412755 RepID=A0A0F9WEP6_9ZZZZ|nr:PhoX family phosphatase [Pseudohongiella sp.]HDZ08280.1 PhoX family phosphatase [Pseudohongiella sp.]HEA62556.1 PhoX family phosphatase [Pseudohongiella sp.]
MKNTERNHLHQIDNSGLEPLSNHSQNSSFQDVLLQRQIGRRQFLCGALATAVSAFMAPAFSALGKKERLGFAAIASGKDDTIHVPEGYTARPFVPWGTCLYSDHVGDDESLTAADQEQQVGSHHDGMHFFPIDGRSDEGLLVMNHEYVDPPNFHPGGPTLGEHRPAGEVALEMAAHGVSVLHVLRQSDGEWVLQQDSRYNRRITGTTPMEFRGAVRGAEGLRTAYSPDGTKGRGTLNNCSHGVTPWGTYLSAEENWAGYFVNHDQQLPREHSRYGLGTEASRYHWEVSDGGEDIHGRFDVSSRGSTATGDFRNEPSQFGWVVEIDPFDPGREPIKHTALGRMAHEGVIFAPVKEGQPLVCYCGDDARYEYIYKFVSRQPYRAVSAGSHLLEDGDLYVARFNPDGSGEWLRLDASDAAFLARANIAGVMFGDQADLLINTRLAADVAGATKMDRPEWGAIDPDTGHVYFTLTNNVERTEAETDTANPRATNVNGHIIRWLEADGDFAARHFEWDIFLLGGETGTQTPGENSVTLTEDNHFASPDGLWFDSRGILWIQTDMSGSQLSDGPFGNNQMLAADPLTGDLRRFLVGPVGCEITGVTMTPDLRTMFVNVQHPGEGSGPIDVSSHWPDGGTSRPRSATVVVTRQDGGVIGS